MIKKTFTHLTGDNQVRMDIDYAIGKLDPPIGPSAVEIVTKNGRVDSVTIQEYDEDGNLVSSSAWFN